VSATAFLFFLFHSVSTAAVLLFCEQLVFRKVADVLREKELAEREKNEPMVELADDHPVRRLISRFRKMSYSRASTGNAASLLSGDLLLQTSPSYDEALATTPLPSPDLMATGNSRSNRLTVGGGMERASSLTIMSMSTDDTSPATTGDGELLRRPNGRAKRASAAASDGAVATKNNNNNDDDADCGSVSTAAPSPLLLSASTSGGWKFGDLVTAISSSSSGHETAAVNFRKASPALSCSASSTAGVSAQRNGGGRPAMKEQRALLSSSPLPSSGSGGGGNQTSSGSKLPATAARSKWAALCAAGRSANVQSSAASSSQSQSSAASGSSVAWKTTTEENEESTTTKIPTPPDIVVWSAQSEVVDAGESTAKTSPTTTAASATTRATKRETVIDFPPAPLSPTHQSQQHQQRQQQKMIQRMKRLSTLPKNVDEDANGGSAMATSPKTPSSPAADVTAQDTGRKADDDDDVRREIGAIREKMDGIDRRLEMILRMMTTVAAASWSVTDGGRRPSTSGGGPTPGAHVPAADRSSSLPKL
jgi:hypothetical protein